MTPSSVGSGSRLGSVLGKGMALDGDRFRTPSFPQRRESRRSDFTLDSLLRGNDDARRYTLNKK